MELAMEALKGCMEVTGSALEAVLKATVFITDEGHFGEMNEVYGRHFSEPFPARSTIVTRLAASEFLLEIEAVATRLAAR